MSYIAESVDFYWVDLQRKGKHLKSLAENVNASTRNDLLSKQIAYDLPSVLLKIAPCPKKHFDFV